MSIETSKRITLYYIETLKANWSKKFWNVSENLVGSDAFFDLGGPLQLLCRRFVGRSTTNQRSTFWGSFSGELRNLYDSTNLSNLRNKIMMFHMFQHKYLLLKRRQSSSSSERLTHVDSQKFSEKMKKIWFITNIIHICLHQLIKKGFRKNNFKWESLII